MERKECGSMRIFDLVLGLRGYQVMLPWRSDIWVKLWRTNRCLLSKVTCGWRAFQAESSAFTKPPEWGRGWGVQRSITSMRNWKKLWPEHREWEEIGTGEVGGIGKGRPGQPRRGILPWLEEQEILWRVVSCGCGSEMIEFAVWTDHSVMVH